MTGHGYSVWPIFVLILTGANLARVLSSRRSIIEGRIAKLERRQARELEPPRSDKKPKPDQGG